MKIEIRKEFNHYTIYVNGKFECTADTREEAERDKKEIIKNRDK